MKLDPRIIKGKKPLDCFDTDIARQFIGEKGYFAEDLSIYANVGYAEARTLQEIADNKTHCFKDNVIDVRWSYFLPEEWVQEKEPEPKYRPYKNYGEMFRDVSVGQIITFRDKGYTSVHYAEIVEAYENKCGDWFVMIGNGVRSFAGWFQTIEVKDPETDQWVPFGIEE